MLTNIIDTARNLLTDTQYQYRWSDEVLISWVNSGVRDIIQKRPDVLIDANGELQAFSAVPIVGAFVYTETGDTGNLVSGYDAIGGWQRSQFSTLYFKATSTTVIQAYKNTDDRTSAINPLFSIAGCDSTGIKTIVALNNSGFGGTLAVDHVAVSGNTWSVAVTSVAMMLPEDFDPPMAYYVASKALEQDSSDTSNMQRSQTFYKEFIERI